MQRPRLQPHAAGLIDRLWYGAASRGSVRWAAQAGLNLLTGNFVFGEGATGFAAAQLAYVREYLERVAPGRPGRVALGRVIVPFDGADASTPKRYQAYEASRHDVAPQLGWRPAVTETSAA